MDNVEIFLGLLSLALAIISLYLAFLVVKMQKPFYYKHNVKIIDTDLINPITNSDPNLKITYNNSALTTLSSTYISIWNAGNQRINRDDIPDSQPLTIKAKEGIRIYRITDIIKKTENSFHVLVDPQYISDMKQNIFHFSFDYFAKDDGVKIQVIHSGKSSEDIEFSGRTKECGPFLDYSLIKAKRKDYGKNIPFAITIISMVFLFSLLYLFPLSVIRDFFNISDTMAIVVISLILLVIFAGGFMLGITFISIRILNYLYPPVPELLE